MRFRASAAVAGVVVTARGPREIVAGMKVGLLLPLLAAAVLGTAPACGLGEINLQPAKVGPLTAGQDRGRGREIVVARSFTDHRPQHGCGMRKNLVDFGRTDVRCQFDPATELADLVAGQLTAAGFAVGRDVRQVGPDTLILTGAVEQVFVEPQLLFWAVSFEADVALVLSASTPAGFRAQRRFYVKSGEAAFTGEEAAAQRAYASSVRQLLASVVGAVVHLADGAAADTFPTAPTAATAPPLDAEAKPKEATP